MKQLHFFRVTTMLAIYSLASTGLSTSVLADPVAGAVAVLPVRIAATSPLVRYLGRFDTSDPVGPRCSWPASEVELRFRGSALNVRLRESGDSDEYQVVVDGIPFAVLVPGAGEGLYNVFTGSKVLTHTVELVKRTESFLGTTQFVEFQLPAGGSLIPLPKPSSRRIEVIGDSISCGFGNEAPDKESPFTPATENAYLAYGAVAARDLGAQYVCIAWSGRKMWPDNTIPEIYDRTIATDPNSSWKFGNWSPDVVVIALGTNDFRVDAPDRAGWTAGYEAFIKHVRTNYPKATIYCALSPMMGGPPYDTLKSYLDQIIRDENAMGVGRIYLMPFATQDGSNGYGAMWHPNVMNDRIIAQTMVQTITQTLGWRPVATN